MLELAGCFNKKPHLISALQQLREAVDRAGFDLKILLKII
jgi:hypothetical protein